MTDLSTTKEKSFIKDSYDKLINLYFIENRLNPEDISENVCNQTFNIEMKNKKINKKIKKKEKSFLNQNFCNENCQMKFQKILAKIKNGEIDLNKINWSLESGGNNLIQNLVNYYYNIGYSEGISHSQVENK